MRALHDVPVASGRESLHAWFTQQGWQPWQFQVDAWEAFAQGKSGLVQVPTGAGKTYAAFGGPLIDMIDERAWEQHALASSSSIHTMYITPLRAVTRDIELALRRPIADLSLPLLVESRTGDTSASIRGKQRTRLPHVLLTTPESLCLLLTRDNARELFAGLACVIVDEWHELLTSKRGTATELALARLRTWNPSLRTWGMSATIPNAAEALCALTGGKGTSSGGPEAGSAVVVRPDLSREVAIRCVIPRDLSRLPWAGHLGLSMLPDVLEQLDPSEPTLVFTNTRSQAERWFHAIQFHRPQWSHLLALHHGSLDREERERVESGLKSGEVRIVVSTSSLDLGVDFAPVRKVLQVGSPKGIARVVQRAGRANHRPGESSAVLCVPTHALELLEVVAAREAFARGELEPRVPLRSPLDVLAQHMVTCALGGGFRSDELFDEVRRAWSYRDLSRQEFDWALHLVSVGGILAHYPQFQRIRQDDSGVWRVEQPRIATLHRLNLGTITSDQSLEVRYASGKRLGMIDEHFIANLHPGEKFVFAGKVLSLITIRDLVVLVRPAPGTTTNTPLWAGTRLPISESLSEALRHALQLAGQVQTIAAPSPELLAAQDFVRVQKSLSVIPGVDQVLAEVATSRDGTHLFVFPFEGRLVHGGLAALLALRLGRLRKASFTFAVNDYGFEVLSPDDYPFASLLREHHATLLTLDHLSDDVAESINMSQLARAAFREVARVAGLVLQNYPGARRTGKQVHASSSLIYDVFQEFDPGNLLLQQARKEVLDRHFEQSRLARTLQRLQRAQWIIQSTPRFTPLSFPLVVERIAAKISSESIADRLAKMHEAWATPVSAQRPGAKDSPVPGPKPQRTPSRPSGTAW